MVEPAEEAVAAPLSAVAPPAAAPSAFTAADFFVQWSGTRAAESSAAAAVSSDLTAASELRQDEVRASTLKARLKGLPSGLFRV